MKKVVLALLTSLILTGCSAALEDVIKAGSGSGNRDIYMCGGEILAVMVSDLPDDIRVWVRDDWRILWRLESASGEKYSDGYYTLWSKGEQATLYKDDEVILNDCWLVH